MDDGLDYGQSNWKSDPFYILMLLRQIRYLRPSTPRSHCPNREQEPHQAHDALEDPVHSQVNSDWPFVQSVESEIEDKKSNARKKDEV